MTVRLRRLDDIAGGAALLARLGVTAEELHDRLDRGDPVARASVDAAGAALGLGLAACINMLNPRVLVIGGGSCGFAGYRDAAVGAAEADSLPRSWAALRIAQFSDPQRFAADGALAARRRVDLHVRCCAVSCAGPSGGQRW